MSKITLVTGGSRSGKSSFALELLSDVDAKAFIATAEPIDEEMEERIRLHREAREDSFVTVEETIDLGSALDRVPEGISAAVLDCVTVWLGNLFHHCSDESVRERRIQSFLDELRSFSRDLVLVTNEIGLGLVPESRQARMYRDRAGRLNQRLAEIADRVFLVISGIPVPLTEISVSDHDRSV